MHPENFIWQLISRSLNGEESQEEADTLNNALQKDESLQQRYEILKQFWHSSSSFATPENEEIKIHVSRIFEKASTNNLVDNNNYTFKTKRLKHRKLRILFGSLTVIIFLSVSVYLLFYGKHSKNDLQSTINQTKLNQLVVRNGSRNRSILPDGSIVWLNAGSSLIYANEFKGLTREVYLKGEAFFNVVKDAKHPFIVHANSVDIKVLGTAFNIKSYVEDNKVEATLIRGIIQVTRQDKNNEKPVFLHPNEKLVIDLKESMSPDKLKPEHKLSDPVFTLYHLDSITKTEDMLETSWMYNRLEFRGDNFEELAKKLERWYNVKILFEDDSVKQLNFNGSFENETVEQAFAALKAAVPFDYTINEHEIFVSSIKKILP